MAKTPLSPQVFTLILPAAHPLKKNTENLGSGRHHRGGHAFHARPEGQKAFQRHIPPDWITFVTHIYSP